jgi:hypothetical protein
MMLLLCNIRWPLVCDPPGSSGANYPLRCTKIAVTILSTVLTWHLHAINGHSPVLASSAIALLPSTCLDCRLGQAVICGTFAGMLGGRLAPNLSIAV